MNGSWRNLVMGVLMTAAIVGWCSGCGAKEKKIKIGLSLPTQREERWVRDGQEFLKAAEESGQAEIKMQISDNDAAKQLSQCENLIAQGIDVLVIAPHDAASAASIVEKARAADIPVVSYDRLILNCDLDLYVSFDNEKVGAIQGEYLTRLVPTGNYIVLAGSPTDNNAKLYRAGAMKAIQPLADKGAIKIVMDQWVKDWKPSEAMSLVENALTANKNNIQGILAPNDGCAGGAIQALAAQGLAGKVPVTGQDAEVAAAQRIVQGTQTMTVYKDTRAQAREAFKAALMLAGGQKPEVNGAVNNGKMDVPSFLLTPLAVDRGNLDSLLIESGYLNKADVYK